jgi:hypothetical protein
MPYTNNCPEELDATIFAACSASTLVSFAMTLIIANGYACGSAPDYPRSVSYWKTKAYDGARH